MADLHSDLSLLGEGVCRWQRSIKLSVVTLIKGTNLRYMVLYIL